MVPRASVWIRKSASLGSGAASCFSSSLLRFIFSLNTHMLPMSFLWDLKFDNNQRRNS